jgi:hypothetical protein
MIKRISIFVGLFILSYCVLPSATLASNSGRYDYVSLRSDQEKKDEKKDEKKPKVSEGEGKAANKIVEAKDLAAKMTLAAEFLKKYPKSEVRNQVADHIASNIKAEKDLTQRVTFSEKYLETFNLPAEAEVITANLIDDYIKAKRADEAFTLAGPWLEKHPDDVLSYAALTFAGTQELLAGNNASPAKNRDYATKAIALIEADKKPMHYADADWLRYKNSWLPVLNHLIAINASREGDKVETRARLEKAVALKSTDPASYALLAEMINDDYVALAAKHKALPAGAEQEKTLNEALATIDKMIELYAQAIALADKPQHEPMRAQLMKVLEDFYKFRHNNSAEGLQQFIDKFKRPAGQ